MVSVVGGLLSSTFWRAVGGDTTSGGRDSLPGGRPGGEAKRRRVIGCVSNTGTQFARKPITNALNGGGSSGGYLRFVDAHFCDCIHCGRDDTKMKAGMGGVSSYQEAEADWVVCGLTPMPTNAVRSGQSHLGLSTAMTYSSISISTTSPGIEANSSNLNFNFNNEYDHSTNNRLTTRFEMRKPLPPTTGGDVCEEEDARTYTDSDRKLVPPNRVARKSTPTPKSNSSTVASSLVNPKAEAEFSSSSTCVDSECIATSGNRSGREAREAWSRQCVYHRQQPNVNTQTVCDVTRHACEEMDGTRQKEEETVTLGQGDDDEEVLILPPYPPPLSAESPVTTTGSNTETTTARVDDSSGCIGSLPRSREEDIRAYDIYKITPRVSAEAHYYSRLPDAVPVLTDSSNDSDSGPDDARLRQGFRKRKRKAGRREERERGKRYREGEGVDDDDYDSDKKTVGLDDITVYTSPSLEDYTNRISILHRLSSSSSSTTTKEPPGASSSSSSSSPSPSSSSNGQRRVSFSLGTKTSSSTSRPPKIPSKISTTLSHTPCNTPSTSSPSSSSSSKQSFNPPRKDKGDVPIDDDSMNDDDDVDDDDEASTVVPDDFDDETDSDIEVLTQSESWVDLSNQPEETPDRVTPLPFGNGEEYIRLLREAQKESNHSSARVSLASSRRDTPRDSPHDSPKSPPNSPNTELTTDPEEAILKGVYINYYNREGDFIRVEKNTETDWIWDWSSRPDQTPPKEWRFSHPGKGVNRGASIRRVMVGKSSLFSRDVLYTLLITNVLSLLIGTGIGIWLSKRSTSGAIVTLPIN